MITSAHPVDGAVERCDCVHAARLCAHDEIRVGEVELVDLVELQCTEEQRKAHHDGRLECEDGADQLSDPRARDLRERAQHVDHFGGHEVGP
jgi:hypothetical protein